MNVTISERMKNEFNAMMRRTENLKRTENRARSEFDVILKKEREGRMREEFDEMMQQEFESLKISEIPDVMKSKIGITIRQELDPLDNFVCLSLVAPQNHEQANYAFAKYMTERGAQGLYVTTNNPYQFLKKKLVQNGVQTDRLYFIDGISQPANPGATADCIYLDHLENLTTLGILINHILSTAAGQKFLIIDSFSTLLLYNAANSLAKFAHFLTARMKSWGVCGIYISLKGQSDPLLISHLNQICDKVLDLSS